MFLPVLLKTDLLLFLLLLIVMVAALYVRRRAHLMKSWLEIVRRPMAASSLIVLIFFVAIAFLDSLHLRLAVENTAAQRQNYYSTEVVSVFDLLATSIREQTEKTYSAPFALHLFVKETIEDNKGGSERGYPRLQYGGRHLETIADRPLDVMQRLGVAFIKAFAIGFFLLIVFLGCQARRQRTSITASWQYSFSAASIVPWKTVMVTLAVFLLLLMCTLELAPYYHILGTDKVGNDVFYQAMKSIRTALLIGTLTTLIMLPFAVFTGLTAGYLRGRIDDLIQYLYTTLSSVPGVLLIASSVLLLQVYIEGHPEAFQSDAERADLRLLFLCIILGITSWTGLCRLLRGETMKLSSVDFVQAATAFGVRPLRILLRHLLPNVMHIVLITVVLDFSGLVLAEAVLSYVGVGVDPSMHSWGNMINSARLEMSREPMVWWSLFAAFLFMFVLVLAANLFSDVVRDVFDPRRRR